MAVSKKSLRNNKKLANNVSLLTNVFSNQRALVVHDYVEGLEAIKVKDFYNVVILETDNALKSVPEPDVLIYSNDSPYKNSVLYYPDLFELSTTLFITNHDALRVMSKIHLDIPVLSATFIPVVGVPGTAPIVARKVPAGLSSNEPGVHLAKIMGCNVIHYTGESTMATMMDKNDVAAFVAQKDRFTPKNFVGIDRATILQDFF